MTDRITTQVGIVAKAQQICRDYAAGKLTIFAWHDLMMKIHYVDCQGDPNESGWVQSHCADLVSEQDWEWSSNEDSKRYQKKFER